MPAGSRDAVAVGAGTVERLRYAEMMPVRSRLVAAPGRLVLAALVLALALAGPRAARADDAGAAAAEGDRLTAARDHRGALAAYRRAAALDPDPARLCPLGLSHDHLGDAPRAYALLAGCADGGELAAAAREARSRRKHELERGDFGLVVITADPAGARIALSFLDGDPTLTAPVSLYLPLGKHTVRITAAGHQPFDAVLEITGRDRRAIMARLIADAPPTAGTVDFEADEPAAGGVMTTPDQRPKKHKTLLPDRYARAGAEAASSGPPPLVDPDPTPPPEPASNLTAWLVLGGGVAAVGAGIGFTVAARAAASDRDALPPDASHVAADDKVRSRTTAAVAFYALGATSLGIATYLLLRGPRTRATASATGDGTGALVTLSHDF